MAAKPRFAYRLGWRSLRKVCPGLTAAQARTLARELGQAMHEGGVKTETQAAACIAQLAHESGGFRWVREFASGEAYEGRRDLGNTHPGDGRRFKGRGFIQITGRANYAAASKALSHDFLAHPDDMALPPWRSKGALWWWKTHGCNELAGDFLALTRRINGGTNGLADRQAYHRRAQQVARFLVPKRRPPT